MVGAPVEVTRPLGGMETGMAVGNERWPLNMVTAVLLGATPEPEILRRTLDDLQRRHPPLRARIEHHGRHRRLVYASTPAIPLRIVDGAADHWTTEVESLLNAPMPTSGPLVAVTLVRHRTAPRADLILAFQHTIVDGVAAATLWGDLLGTYAALAAGAAPDRPIEPIPVAADALIPERYRGRRLLASRLRFAAGAVRDEWRFRRSVDGRAPGVAPSARTIVDTRTFDESQSRAIERAARARHCTVHSLLHAVVLRSVLTARYGDADARLRTIAFADLRPHLDPSPPPSALSPYVALTSQDVDIAAGSPLWDTVGAVQRELRASVRREAKFVRYSMAAPLMRMATRSPRWRMGTTAVSHTGPVSLGDADGPLRVETLHAFVSNLAIGPELSLRTGSFRGRLTLDMMTLDTDMDRARLAELAARIVGELEAIATEAEVG